ncbi:hypothetical protein RchiOBHm_Chr2g0144931 [Rosa chinensis]|uniref:Uncharacterized protein n=1 Tax=Rosa chinensis TaxID=74649 RepID=A0A2P6RYJ8_ROSCH|nr:hypothetical protein RchiOBHm_Chr2g0144931 [Rosa chinensis]
MYFPGQAFAKNHYQPCPIWCLVNCDSTRISMLCSSPPSQHSSCCIIH